MCLAIPARIVSIDGTSGVIDVDGVRREVSLLLVPDAADRRVRAGPRRASRSRVIDEDEAQQRLEAFAEIRRLLETERVV